MVVANTVAYYDTATTTYMKGSILQSPGANLSKKRRAILTHIICKQDHFNEINFSVYIH